MTSFKKNSGLPIPVDAEVVNTPTSVPTTETAVAVAPPSIRIGSVTGEVTSKDIKMPTLNIVQSVGPLSETHEPGQIVLNKDLVLAEPEGTIILSVLTANPYYLENVPYGEDKVARIWRTEAEVKEAGLHLEWINDKKPPVGRAMDTLVAIQSDVQNALSPYEFDGHFYALANWGLRGTAFNRAGKILLTASQYNLKSGLHFGSWTLSTRREKLGSNWVWVPVIKAAARNSDAMAKFFTTLV